MFNLTIILYYSIALAFHVDSNFVFPLVSLTPIENLQKIFIYRDFEVKNTLHHLYILISILCFPLKGVRVLNQPNLMLIVYPSWN